MVLTLHDLSLQASHGIPLEDFREPEIVRKIDDLKESDRNVDAWFSDFDAEMSDYNDLLWDNGNINGTVNETSMCDYPNDLRAQLDSVRAKIELVM